MVNIGLIGYGYWGPNLLRNFSHLYGCTVKTVADMDEERLKLVSKLYPHVAVCNDANTIFNDPDIDAVVIATPISTHYPLAKKALEHNKHVFIVRTIKLFFIVRTITILLLYVQYKIFYCTYNNKSIIVHTIQIFYCTYNKTTLLYVQ